MLIKLILFSLVSFKAWSFPEMIRHGYVNCTSCHLAPTGGGLLNNYGRELSRDVLSTWGKEGNEAQPFYGILPKIEGAYYGGNARYIQTYLDNPYVSQGRAFTMQSDLEAAFNFKKVTAHGSYGVVKHTMNGKTVDKLDSRKHYLMMQFDQKNYVRAGKFQTPYGLTVPDHIIAVKKGLGFDQGTETYNLELGHQGQAYGLLLHSSFGRPDDETLSRDKSILGKMDFSFLKTYKVGLNYFKGSSLRQRREIYGLYALLGFFPRFYMLSEVDMQNSQAKRVSSNKTKGLYYYHKIGYEFFQGLHFFLSHDYARSNIKLDHNKVYNIGPGLLWYPRPHFEFNLSWQKQKNPALTDKLTDFAWITGNFYF